MYQYDEENIYQQNFDLKFISFDTLKIKKD